MIKALREAKVNTSWLAPNAPYEETVARFATVILQNKSFLNAFLPFQQKIAHYGAYNTLSQTLLKITCPGIPDFYQGSEVWNLSMVTARGWFANEASSKQKTKLFKQISRKSLKL